MSPPASSTSTSAQSSAANLTRSTSVKTTATSPTKPSNVTLFVANLRLLAFDRRDDWPGITQETFATKDAQQNQRSRIRCVEWALFRLFELWNPTETREKLQPFFPPLEPLQSVNLRAALYRSLDSLKKNGNFGHDVVLRKTMLDECKGDKFFEVLLYFSTLVLQRMATTGKRGQKQVWLATYAGQLATDTSMLRGEDTLPLILAHRLELSKILSLRTDRSEEYAAFAHLLDDQRAKILERQERSSCNLEKNKLEALGPVDAALVGRQLRDNWLGSPEWLRFVCSGSVVALPSGLLEQHFVNVWAQIEQRQPLHTSRPQDTLLQDLEETVTTQQQRLRRWQRYHDELKQTKKPNVSARKESTPRQEIVQLKFREHVGMKKEVEHRDGNDHSERAQIHSAYDLITLDMSKGLEMAAKSKKIGGDGWHAIRQPLKPDTKFRPPTQELPRSSQTKPAMADPKRARPISEVRKAPEAASSGGPSINQPETQAPETPALCVSPPNLESKRNDLESEAVLGADTTPIDIHAQQSMIEKAEKEEEKKETMTFDLQSRPSEAQIIKQTQSLADQIVSAAAEPTPKPAKAPRQSLLERTRMSMAGRADFKDLHPTSEAYDGAKTGPREEADEGSDFPSKVNRRESLLDRTRQSMSKIPAQDRTSRRSSNVSKARQSLYPVNQFETPQKQASIWEDEERDTTPKEKLFTEEADYASVFKSRPKIALSPINTPDQSFHMTEVDGSNTSDDGWASSPLRRKVPIG